MNCPNCQNPMSPGAVFCSRCGNKVMLPVDPYAQQYQQQKNALRQGEMNALGKLLDYFSPMQAEYDAYDGVCQKLLHYARGAKSALLIWGGIALGLGLSFVLLGVSENAREDELLPFLWLLVVPGVLMLAGGIVMKLLSRSRYRSCLESYTQLSQSLYRHYLGYPNCPVGPEYTNPRILHALLQTLRSGRCDTVKESINCMVSGFNYSQIANYCQQLQRITAPIDAQTRVGTIFAAARFFK